MRAIAGLVRHFGLLAVVPLLAGCNMLTGAVGDLKLGECFDQPSATSDIAEVQHRPCNEAHDAEVFAALTHPAPAGDFYPIEMTMTRYLSENCSPAFNTYTGLDYETDTTYDFGAFYPTRESWNNGDRGVICYLYRLDEQKLTQSVAASAP